MNTADPTTWLDVLGAASPLLAALLAVVGVIGTIVFTNRREKTRQEHERILARDRQEHERLLKEAEIEEGRMTRQREDRLRAYSTLARLTNQVNAEEQAPVIEVSGALSEIEILTDNPELKRASDALVGAWEAAWQSAFDAFHAGAKDPHDPKLMRVAKERRTTFIRLVKEEITPKVQAHQEPTQGSTPEEALPGSETTTS